VGPGTLDTHIWEAQTPAMEESKVDMGERAWELRVRASLLPPVLPSAVMQSVLCGADALVPVQTGAAGSASLALLGNGSLIYQVRVRVYRWWGGPQGRALTCNSLDPRPWLSLQFALPELCPPGASGRYQQ
jgi:hypothetical protein